ncbi:hypothetical protein C0J52_09742, partial [Blattella germanica]
LWSLTLEQKVKTLLFYVETKSVVDTQQRFRVHYHTIWAPCRQTVEKVTRAATVHTPENVEAVRVTLTQSPGKSTWRASAELNISCRSLQRILHLDLKLFPYKFTVMHKLNENDKDLCRRVVRNFTVRLEALTCQQGGHIEHVLQVH